MKKQTKLIDQGKCLPSSECCSSASALPRREFMKLSSLGATALAFPFIGCSPVSYSKTGHLIPADKKLSPEWIKSLTERGAAEVYSSSKDQLKYIGMPIGGICCGQLYISGDGRLWLWDIFQSNYEREGPAEEQWRLDQFTMGGLYPNPRISRDSDIHQVSNGFAIQYQQEDQTEIIPLDDKGFDDISFRGEYPIAKIEYKNEKVPLEINLTAYSPFIPLNVKDSSIPTTILNYEVHNVSIDDMTVGIGGWLENRVCPEIQNVKGIRTNKVVSGDGKTTVFMTASGDGLSKRKGYGNMAISLLGDVTTHNSCSGLNNTEHVAEVFEENEMQQSDASLDESLVGSLSTSFALEPGQSKVITFLISWYFPEYNEPDSEGVQMNSIQDFEKLKRYYSLNFSDANDVAAYVSQKYNRLSNATLLWNKTWYDSSLPHWFLDRSFISMDCLASQTSHMFDNGRFWGWEGVDCCEGTCSHVWQYAQGMARIFPSIEKDLRQRVDYGIAYSEEGSISFRGENLDTYTGTHFAVDGQLGTIIRVYREHQMSSNPKFLEQIWSKVKKCMLFVIDQDIDLDGLLEGKQPHTLDAAWYGPMGWISGMYIAALKACGQMAFEVGDEDFAKQCEIIIPIAQGNLVKKLFNDEYFIHLPPDFKAVNTNKGCHIDQVIGQSFAYQVNLPDVLPSKETRSALASLWKYNFAPDAGKYAFEHSTIKGDRKYAMSGESGLLMTTWPIGGDENAVPGMDARPVDSPYWIGPGGYFDECMNGFEYQVASHMVWEGMLTEGLSIMKAVHDRYGAAKRNPYDEVECSSHYSRSMASYGVYLAACGYHYHGPKGELGFAPKINPEKFKCAFTVAEGWGSFTQKITDKTQENTIEINYGSLTLNMFSIVTGLMVKNIHATINGEKFSVEGSKEKDTYNIKMNKVLLNMGDKLKVVFKN